MNALRPEIADAVLAEARSLKRIFNLKRYSHSRWLPYRSIQKRPEINRQSVIGRQFVDAQNEIEGRIEIGFFFAETA